MKSKNVLSTALVLILINLVISSCSAKKVDFWWQAPQGPAYQVLVYSFADSNNDGLGDLNGLREKLDYLADTLNVQALWLSPINPSSSYHGYDVTDYYGIDPRLGTMEDFEALVSEAHTKGIRIILDEVFNHSGRAHPWFQSFANDAAGPYKDYYLERKPEIKYGSGGMGGFHSLPDGRQFFAAFWDGMPDLNLENKAVKNELKKILNFWLGKGVDGFRFDAVKHAFDPNEIEKNQSSHQLNKKFWIELVSYAQSKKKDVFTVGEVLTEAVGDLPGWGGVFSTLFDFPGATNLIKTGALPNSQNFVNDYLIRMKQYNKNAPYFPSYLISNHDQDRIMSTINSRTGNDEAASNRWMRMLAAITHTLPGLPWIYYGEELGMEGRRWANDDINRRLGFPWTGSNSPPTPTWALRSGKTEPLVNKMLLPASLQLTDQNSLLTLYASLSSLRSIFPSLRNGKVLPLSGMEKLPDGLLAWFVRNEEETILVVHNGRPERSGFRIEEKFGGSAAWSSFGTSFQPTGPVETDISLEAGESKIWRLSETIQ